MIRVRYNLFYLGCAIALISIANISYAQKYSYPREFDSLNSFFEASIPHIEEGYGLRVKEAYKQFGSEAFSELDNYLDHPNAKVRRSAYRLLLYSIRNTPDLSIRKIQFNILLKAFEGNDANVRQPLSRQIITFGFEVYNPASKEKIYTLLHTSARNMHHYKNIMLAAGIAQIIAAMPIIKDVDDHTSAYVLARLGDHKALEEILSLAPSKPSGVKFNEIFRDLRLLAYTKQPAAIDRLISFLSSDTVLLKRGSDYGSVILSQLVAENLVELIPDLTIKRSEARSPYGVYLCRNWIRKNYDSSKLPDIFPGEIQYWD